MLIFGILKLAVSCNLKESFNPNDPKHIFGGISSSSLAPSISDAQISNSTLEDGYIEFDLKIKVRNCTIDGLSNLEISFNNSAHAIAINAKTIHVLTLGRDESSDYLSVGWYKICKDKLDASDTFNFKIQNASNSWIDSTTVH